MVQNVIEYIFADCAPREFFTVGIMTAGAAFLIRFPIDIFTVVVKNVAKGAVNALVLWTMCADNFKSSM